MKNWTKKFEQKNSSNRRSIVTQRSSISDRTEKTAAIVIFTKISENNETQVYLRNIYETYPTWELKNVIIIVDIFGNWPIKSFRLYKRK